MRTRLLFLVAVLALGALAPAARADGPPLIEATFVEGVSATGATLWAEINPNGSFTSYRFEYVTDDAYRKSGFAGASTLPPSGPPVGIGGGNTAVPINRHLSGLTPATTYHYRVWATNSVEAIFGAEHVLSTQESTNLFVLPDGRAWEMVSPVEKEGGAIQGPGQNFGGDLDQAAAQGDLFTYSSATAFGQAPGAPPASQYLAARGASGWSSANVSTPLHAAAYGDEPNGVPYRLFSTDLGRGLLFGGDCRAEEGECAFANPPLPDSGAPSSGYANYYLRDSVGGGLTALLGQSNFAESSLGPKALQAHFVAASPDLFHVVLSSCAALTPDASEAPSAPGRCDSEELNLYKWSSSGLSLINILPGDTEGTTGAEIAASLGAVSADGSRVYWSLGGDLYLREAGQSVQVDATAGGGGSFQTASADGSIAYFIKAAHLYRWSAQTQTATDVTPAGGVAGVLGASADGLSVYYQDATGLELRQEDTTTQLAAGASVASSTDYPPSTGTARVSPDGAHLAFLSAAELTGADSAGFTQAYLYGPPPGGGSPLMSCASCNPSGEKTQGSASFPGAPPNGSPATPYKPRVLSANGQRLFFEVGDSLASQDTNLAPDVYQWESKSTGSCQRAPGCVNLISSGRSAGGSTFLDASADGSDVFFLTNASLVGSDPGSVDIYDAKVGGGFAEAAKPIPCIADACQALPAAPDDPTPGTLVPNSGNPTPSIVKEKRKRHHKKKNTRRHHEVKNHKGGRR